MENKTVLAPYTTTLTAEIPADRFLPVINAALKKFIPQLETALGKTKGADAAAGPVAFYVLKEFKTAAASGHLTDFDCLLVKNPSVEDDRFYEVEKKFKLLPEEVKSLQADMTASLTTIISKGGITVQTPPTATWQRGDFSIDLETGALSTVIVSIKAETVTQN